MDFGKEIFADLIYVSSLKNLRTLKVIEKNDQLEMSGRRRRPRPHLPMLRLSKQLANISQSESSKSKYGVQVSENLFISNIYQASDPEFIKGHNITAIISVHSKELPNQIQDKSRVRGTTGSR